MEPIYLETEHQELFIPACDPRVPVKIHIPSALGALGYYVLVRVHCASVSCFARATTHLRVGGLRPDDVTLGPGEGFEGPSAYPTTDPDHAWLVLCRALVSRGDGLLSLSGLEGDPGPVDLLLCTWPRFVASGEADQWLACQRDPAWAPNGIPLGGIGSGKVEISRDGRFRNFSGNNNQDMPFEEPDGLEGAYLAVQEGDQLRALATRSVQLSDGAIPPAEALTMTGAFPRTELAAPGIVPGLDVNVALAGPCVPHDPLTASLPGFILRWTLCNRTDQPRTVTARLGWPNLVGRGGGIGRAESNIGYADGYYSYWDAPTHHTSQAVETPDWVGLEYRNAPSQHGDAADGEHWLATRARTGTTQVGDDPRLGYLATTVDLAPGATETVDMVVAWHMPNWRDTLDKNRGHYWQRAATDGRRLVDYFWSEFEHILDAGSALGELFAATDLPAWLTDRLQNACYPLVTNSVFYRDGRFSINEGPTEMAGCYGTIDQRLGAHMATQVLFPSLNAQELTEFADYQADNGGINHDLGAGNLERGKHEQAWPDLTCSFIIQCARHAWSTGDTAFEAAMWPRVLKALRRHAEWATEGNGVAQVGHGLGTSYDGYHYEGTTPYMATLWLATLAICREWTTRQGDNSLLADLANWEKVALGRLEQDLWNGRYYRAYGSQNGRLNDNCHAGMLAGEYYARLLAGRDILPADRLEACATAWFELNGHDQFQIPPDEVGPDGGAGSEYGWLPYVESFGLAPLAVLRHPRVLPVWQRMVWHMAENGRRPCDTRLMYQPVTGEISWGSYYMTAPACWLVYDALLDFAFDAGPGVFRLAPQFDGRFALVHPRFWATGTQTTGQDGGTLTVEIVRVFGDGPLQIRALETIHPATPTGPLAAGPATREGAYARQPLQPINLTVGTTLTWHVPGQKT